MGKNIRKSISTISHSGYHNRKSSVGGRGRESSMVNDANLYGTHSLSHAVTHLLNINRSDIVLDSEDKMMNKADVVPDFMELDSSGKETE
jgi:hypothetical protein